MGKSSFQQDKNRAHFLRLKEKQDLVLAWAASEHCTQASSTHEGAGYAIVTSAFSFLLSFLQRTPVAERRVVLEGLLGLRLCGVT